MWTGYLTAIDEFITGCKLTNSAILTADRFHIAQLYRAGFDKLRKAEFKRLKATLDKETSKPLLHRLHWVLRHNYKSLDDDEKQRLRTLFSVTPELHQAYTLREELTAIFNLPLTVKAAKKRLLAWGNKVETQGISCFDSFVKLLRGHLDIVANYFRRRANSGFVEGLNTKLKLITRRSYGLRRVDSLFRRLWIDTEGYRRFLA